MATHDPNTPAPEEQEESAASVPASPAAPAASPTSEDPDTLRKSGRLPLPRALRIRRLLARAAESLGARIAKLNDPSEFADLCAKFGVEAPVDLSPEAVALGPPTVVSAADAACGTTHTPTALLFCEALEPRFQLAEVKHRTGLDLSRLTDAEIGSPGTYVSAGLPSMDPNAAFSRYIARGSTSQTGAYHKHLLDPLVHKHVASIQEALVQGSWGIHVPAGLDDEERERQRAAADRVWDALCALEGGGWDQYVEDAAGIVYLGFAPFEVVWDTSVEPEEPLLPLKIALRDQTTVSRWYFDENERELVGGRFQTAGDNSRVYVLPATGPELRHRRLLVATLGGQGINVEGFPPNRTLEFGLAKKRLIQRIEAVCAERFGGPILVIRHDSAILTLLAEIENLEPAPGEVEEFHEDLRYLRAEDTATLAAPAGMYPEYVGPEGIMPNFREQLEYIDAQTSLAYSAQASILAHQGTHGSYALAKVQGDDFSASIPRYARKIAQPINDLLRHIFSSQFGLDPRGRLPIVAWSPRQSRDVSRWIGDLIKVLAVRDQLSPQLRAIVAEEMDLPPDALEQVEEQVEESDLNASPSPTGEEQEGNASPDYSDPRAAARAALGLSERVRQLSSMRRAAGFAELPSGVDSLNPEGLERVMDAVQLALGDSLARIQRDMKADYKVLVRDNLSADDFDADLDRLAATYKPVIRAAVDAAMRDAQARAADLIITDLGVAEGVYTPAIDSELEVLAVRATREALGRITGTLSAAEVERARGDNRRSVPTLSDAALLGVAAAVVSSAVTRARHEVVSSLLDEATTRGQTVGRVTAVRTSVLDSNTCEACRMLDGRRTVVGSDTYFRLTPPNRCSGRERCRCMWDYDLPFEALQAAGIVDLQAQAARDAGG